MPTPGTCPACGQQADLQSPTCPWCGHRLNSSTPAALLRMVAILTGLFGVYSLLMAINNFQSWPQGRAALLRASIWIAISAISLLLSRRR